MNSSSLSGPDSGSQPPLPRFTPYSVVRWWDDIAGVPYSHGDFKVGHMVTVNSGPHRDHGQVKLLERMNSLDWKVVSCSTRLAKGEPFIIDRRELLHRDRPEQPRYVRRT